EGTPTALVDGKATEPLGGLAEHGKERYETLRKLIDADLEKPARAGLKVQVRRKGDRLDLRAEVEGLKKPGDNVRLRFVLVEDVVHYAGGNGQRFHHHVVRALPGGARGFALV